MEKTLTVTKATAESKKGSCGKRIKLEGNVINLHINKNKIVHCYAVYFSKRLLSEEFRNTAVGTFMNKLQPSSGQDDTERMHHIYNGTILFLSKKLPKNVMKLKLSDPQVQDLVTVTSAKTIEMCVMHRSKRNLSRCPDLLKYIATSLPKFLGYQPLHRIFYDPLTCKRISDLKLYGGVRIRLAQTETPGLIIDCLHCYQQTKTIHDVWVSLNRTEESKIVQSPLPIGVGTGQGDCMEIDLRLDERLRKLKEYCLGRPVVNDDNGKLYEIADITVNEDKTEPLLWVWTKAYLVDEKVSSKIKEVCITIDPKLYHVPTTRNGYPPSERQKSDNQNLVRVSPQIRVEAIFRVLELISHNTRAQELLQSWGLTLDKELVSFYGRVIPSPKVEFGGGLVIQNASKLFWDPKTERPKIKVYHSINFEDWLVFCQQSDVSEAKNLVQTMRIKSVNLGIRTYGMGSIIPVPILSTQVVGAFVDSIRQNVLDSNPQFIIVVLPNVPRVVEQELYGQLKKLCSVELKIVSQMVRSITCKKISRPILVASLLTQLNLKLGGSLWAVHIPMFELKHEKVMFIGMDVWHGSTTKTFSAAAMICTLNSTCTKFYSSAMMHDFRRETFYEIQFEFQLALAAFYEENGQLPDRIMVFRDGVHRREYDKTLNIEVQSFMAAIENVYETDPKPFFSMVICHKRIYERFFVQKNGKYTNPPPGTLVDNTFTRNKSYDFFLISKYKRKGTVIPGHYVMLYDNSNLTPDAVHEITNALCYAYFNWPGTFYVPCVVQYAHKLAAFVGRCGALPSAMLEKQLYFL